MRHIPWNHRETSARTRAARSAVMLLALTFALVGIPGSPAAPAAAPTNTGEPSISGTPREGHTLTTTSGTWTGTEPMTFAYRWLRCGPGGGRPDGSNCSSISGATATTYVARRADVGSRLRVRVTATNAEGTARVASNPTELITFARPTNTSSPTISGSPVVGNRLDAGNGTWTGDQPITYTLQWLRCSSSGGSCSEIGGATSERYVVSESDVGRRLRVRVTARNDEGSRSATSAPTGLAQRSGTPPSTGQSISVSSVPKGERLVVSQVRFEPSVITTRDPITVRVRVTDTRGFVVRDATVFIRATPRVTTGNRLTTATDGWVTFQLQPLSTFPLRRGAVQFFVKAYRQGDPPLAGVAGYRLVQVITR
jgi:hypothetical protein